MKARWSGQVHRLSVVVALVGLVLTGALAALVRLVNDANEQGLLKVQVSQAAAALAGSLPAIQATLEADHQVAVATKASATIFDSFAASQVGPHESFVSVSLWQLGATPRRLALVGAVPELGELRGGPTAVFAKARPGALLNVVSLLSAVQPRLGYVEEPAGGSSDLAVYASQVLTPGRRLVVTRSSPFADLNFALYLGSTKSRLDLLESSGSGPLRGRQASAVVAFGDTTIMVIASPRHDLGGYLSDNLVWIVSIAGLAISVVAGLTVERLIRDRSQAEGLALENRRLYAGQRAVAETLQHALLPAELPVLAGLETAARYVPGVDNLEIGGDWYDIVALDDSHCAFVVGDVSGRGLAAASTMASLRFAIRAHVAQGDPPEKVLDKLGGLLSVERDGQFATVICGSIDVGGHRIKLCNAGHLPAVLVSDQGAQLVQLPLGPPIGVPHQVPRESFELAVPPGATLLVVTDGLVERRGESLDDGLERLRSSASAPKASLDATLDRMLEVLVPEGSHDDIAILGIRWHS